MVSLLGGLRVDCILGTSGGGGETLRQDDFKGGTKRELNYARRSSSFVLGRETGIIKELTTKKDG